VLPFVRSNSPQAVRTRSPRAACGTERLGGGHQRGASSDLHVCGGRAVGKHLLQIFWLQVGCAGRPQLRRPNGECVCSGASMRAREAQGKRRGSARTHRARGGCPKGRAFRRLRRVVGLNRVHRALDGAAAEHRPCGDEGQRCSGEASAPKLPFCVRTNAHAPRNIIARRSRRLRRSRWPRDVRVRALAEAGRPIRLAWLSSRKIVGTNAPDSADSAHAHAQRRSARARCGRRASGVRRTQREQPVSEQPSGERCRRGVRRWPRSARAPTQTRSAWFGSRWMRSRTS
jgi:hypothetical protein